MGDKAVIMIVFVIVQPCGLLYTEKVPVEIHQHDWVPNFSHYVTFFLQRMKRKESPGFS